MMNVILVILVTLCVGIVTGANAHRHGDNNHMHAHLANNVMYRYTNQKHGDHHKHNANHLYRHTQTNQPHAAKVSNYDLVIAEQELRDILRAQHQYGYLWRDYQNDDDNDEWDEMDATSAWLRDAANRPVGEAQRMFVAVEIRGADEPRPVLRHIIKVRWPTEGGALAEESVLFRWDEYKEKLDEGLLSNEQKLSVYGEEGLRKQTQIELLTYAVELNGLEIIGGSLEDDPFYNEMGSLTAKSDLDFSYIRWDHPDKVVPILVAFTNKHVEIIDLFTLEAFDMNFYDVTGFIGGECWRNLDGAEHRNVRALFDQIWTNGVRIGRWRKPEKALYEFAGQYHGDKNTIYKNHDSYLAYLLIQRRFDDFAEGGENKRIIRVIRYSEMLYYTIDKIKKNNELIRKAPDYLGVDDEKLNQKKLYLKTLRYLINYWSDEAYFSNQALQLIFDKGVEEINNRGKYLAILDNVAFIHHYYLKSQKSMIPESVSKLLHFWNDASKYINRVSKIINHLSAKAKAFKRYDEFKATDTAWPTPPTLETVKAFNLYKLAERWTRAWKEKNAAGGYIYGDGNKKIRGDVPFKYFRIKKDGTWKTTTIPTAVQNPFLNAAIPEARAIWKTILSRFKERKDSPPIDQLYYIINNVRKYIEDFFDKIKFKHKETLKKIYEEIESAGDLLKDKIKIVTVPGGTQKKIKYKAMSTFLDALGRDDKGYKAQEELKKKITRNPFEEEAFQKELEIYTS